MPGLPLPRRVAHALNNPSLRFAIRISVFGIALSGLWTPLNTLLLPDLVSGVVSETFRGTAIGVLTFLGIGIAIVLQPLFGSVSDSIKSGQRRRYFIVPLGAAMACIIPLLGVVPAFWLLLCVYIGLQLVSNGAQTSYQALVPDLVKEKEREHASGIKTAFDVLGTATGLIIVGGLTGLNVPNIGVLGALSLVVAGGTIAVWYLVPKSPRQEQTNSVWNSLAGAFTPLWRGPSRFRRAVLSRFVFLLGLYPVEHFLIYYLQDRFEVRNATTTASAGILGALFVASIAAAVSGPLANAIGRAAVLRTAVILAALGVAGLAFAPGVLFTAPAGILLAIGVGLFDAMNWSVLTESVRGNDGARFLGVANMATAGASACAGLIGPLVDVIRGFAPDIAYRVVFSLAAAIVLITLLTLSATSDTQKAD